MNNIEESLWNYIDGTCNADEQKTISALIESDAKVKKQYQELLRFNNQFTTIELDEPSLAFTYKVMETIRNERALVPLKATINKRIVLGIASFFVLTISVLLIYIGANINWSAGNVSSAPIPSFKIPDLSGYLKGPVMQGFLFFDVVLGLFLLDGYLRKRNFSKQVQ